jgi:putative intracellular protease/amidase
LYSKAANYTSHVIVDGNIITGQNPASSEGVAKKMVALLQLDKHKPEMPLFVPKVV